MSQKINIAFLALGSNIEPEVNLVRAVGLLREYGAITARPSVYQTAPQGFTDQPDFLNMAVQLETALSIDAVKTDAIARIERELKRVRDPNNKNAPRTIDLDIALWNDDIRDYGEKPWHVPDANVLRFAHVALPLAEIAPGYVHPESGDTLQSIAARFDTSGYKIRTDIDFDSGAMSQFPNS